jgi:hypothetical protein
MDLLKLSESMVTGADEGAWCVVKHPVTGEPIGSTGKIARIKLLGSRGQRYQKILTDLRDLDAQDQVRTLGQVAGASNTAESEAAANIALNLRRIVRVLTAITLEWEWIDWGGKENIACTPANMESLYSHTAMGWLRTDLSDFYLTPSNYPYWDGKAEPTNESPSLDETEKK